MTVLSMIGKLHVVYTIHTYIYVKKWCKPTVSTSSNCQLQLSYYCKFKMSNHFNPQIVTSYTTSK